LLKTAGRLGHATQIGGAIWAEQRQQNSVAVALSGCGEYIAQTLLAKTIADSLLKQTKTGVVHLPVAWFYLLMRVTLKMLFLENRSGELISFHNTEELAYAFGRSGAVKKYRSRSKSGAFIAHAFPLSDYIFCS
uniref:FAD-dependent oxidoreductase n=1 Tax=Gongylonema pulchrum TaxID=637853 RepID=A0A183EA28_9BILA